MSKTQPMPTDSDFPHTLDPSVAPITSIKSDVLELTLPTNVNPSHSIQFRITAGVKFFLVQLYFHLNFTHLPPLPLQH